MTEEDERPDLFDVLCHYGWHPPLPRSGWQPIQCEVHGDRNASASINYDLAKIRCHACAFRGDVYDVIMYHEGVEYAAARGIGKGFAHDERKEVRGDAGGLARRGVPGWARNQSSGRSYTPAWLRR